MQPSGDHRLARLPQEDMCQATGVAPDAKYEADGGPGMDRILDTLDGSMTREQDRRDFFKAQLLFWMRCATDGHAKNLCLFLRPGGRCQTTPLYDMLSAYPVLGDGPARISPFRAKMAMAVRPKDAHWKMRDIARRHWMALGASHGILTVGGGDAESLIDETVDQVSEVVAKLGAQLPQGFDAQLADAIFNGIQTAAGRLAD